MKKMGHPRFYQLLGQLAVLHSKKTNDYSGDIPLQDLRESVDLDVEPWIGSLLRMTHKFARLKQLVKGRKIMCRDEKITDTLMDIASGALITIILCEEYEKRNRKNGKGHGFSRQKENHQGIFRARDEYKKTKRE